MQAADVAATPIAQTQPPKVVANSSVFFEGYTDSPEFTHIDNPVIYMEKEKLPEEEPMRTRPSPPRRHPLSQVMNADSPTSSPLPSLVKHVLPPSSLSVAQMSGPPDIITISDSSDDEEEILVIEEEHGGDEDEEELPIPEEDEDNEEPSEDTFQFLLR